MKQTDSTLVFGEQHIINEEDAAVIPVSVLMRFMNALHEAPFDKIKRNIINKLEDCTTGEDFFETLRDELVFRDTTDEIAEWHMDNASIEGTACAAAECLNCGKDLTNHKVYKYNYCGYDCHKQHNAVDNTKPGADKCLYCGKTLNYPSTYEKNYCNKECHDWHQVAESDKADSLESID